MKTFTTALLACATVMGVSAQEMIIDDDFSWLNNPAINSSATLHDTTKEGENVFNRDVLTSKGIQNPGWETAVFDLNDDHTMRLGPADDNPTDIFAKNYSSVYMRPGYLKLGRTDFAGAVVSPLFEKLGTRTADVEVTLQMCGYTSAGNDTKPGNKDATNVHVGLWDGSDGEIADADYEQIASGWTYDCKKLVVTNYFPSKFQEYGENYDVWDKSHSLYTVKVNGATAKTRLYIFGGGYGMEIKGRTEPATITQNINGTDMTFTYKPNINRIGLKGCWVKVLKITDEGDTGIDEINADDNAPAEYFNLQGVRVANPVKGQIYIKRQGAKVTKISY